MSDRHSDRATAQIAGARRRRGKKRQAPPRETRRGGHRRQYLAGSGAFGGRAEIRRSRARKKAIRLFAGRAAAK
ncbi:MAG TPA: hypothetical protein VN181_03485 [Thermoanaerobaculia bacterium]|nr:hypothetical protein [Thermoanaerobaculia bacterium]